MLQAKIWATGTIPRSQYQKTTLEDGKDYWHMFSDDFMKKSVENTKTELKSLDRLLKITVRAQWPVYTGHILMFIRNWGQTKTTTIKT